MNSLQSSALVDLTIHTDWEKHGISHRDTFFADQLNCWRDVFSDSPFAGLVEEAQKGSPALAHAGPGELVPEYREDRVLELDASRLAPELLFDQLQEGRFYPRGMITGIPGVFRANKTPFRCVGIKGNRFTADFNHPLAGLELTLETEPREHSLKPEERGGHCTDWMEAALSGPGMQARYNGKATAFFNGRPFRRRDEAPDPDFYVPDRFVHHIDRTASQNLSAIYGSILRPGDRVLDLMASWESHLPYDGNGLDVHGIGLNPNELAGNPAFSGYTLQDLNADTRLHFSDHSFDAVICSLSVEYLTEPVRIFREAARVLKPGGTFTAAFSNRWFPEKAIRIWEELHDFERMGLVTEYVLETGAFETVSTASVRGYPRPEEDRYYPKFRLSDPVYVVTAQNSA